MSMWLVDLRNAHTFPDMTPIPNRLMPPPFQLEVFDDMDADGDWAVSDSIKRHGVWEPVETAVMCSAFAAAEGRGLLLDFGCHVGWYTVLARQWGLKVAAYDWSQDCCDMIARRDDGGITVIPGWIDDSLRISVENPEESLPPIIVKMDVEGAEIHIVRAMSAMFAAHQIHQALVEMSPVFNTSYPHIANLIIGKGYECWVLPNKQTPPPVMDDTRRWLTEDCKPLHTITEKMRRSWINDQHQFNAVFCLPEATWG